MSISGVLWPPANCHTSLFCTEDVKNKLVQLFCCYLRKAYPTFYFTNFTCRSMFVSLFLRNCQKDRIPQSFWECKHMYFSFMKCFSFLLSFHFFASKEGHSDILWRKRDKCDTRQYLILSKRRCSRSVFWLSLYLFFYYKWLALVMIQFSMYCYLQNLSVFMYFLLCQCWKHEKPLTKDSSHLILIMTQF